MPGVNNKGLTFIEIMVTLAIISTGLVAIFKTYIFSLDQMSHLTTRLYANSLLDNQVIEIERMLKIYKTLPLELQQPEPVNVGYKKIEFFQKMKISAVEDYVNVFRLDLTINWSEGLKEKSLSRTSYITDAHVVN
ncbi:MAG: prepilin-type N-terminal cleavage/methylation domain-containing protein [Candidatus Omnitrophica bacterium]|nr:prepilin-type N-terminal cleavage/methylation domain-containing protein [Candidatus Omnitrophota bacterium]